ncbi:MAG: PDDEXK nuclease domain-containing protein [Ferruginibacter sp.]
MRKGKGLFQSIEALIRQARQQVVRNVNTTMLLTYFEIGRLIVEDEQEGKERAAYAEETLQKLSTDLTKAFGKGYSADNLQNMRKFFLTYSIYETVSRKSSLSVKSESVVQNSKRPGKRSKSETPSRFSVLPLKSSLSWSHYVLLLKINNAGERKFYEIESEQNNWSVRELKRQFSSSLYERVALSKDKKGVKKTAKKGQIVEAPTDVLKSHYVLEFLGLKEDVRYSESDLETAIINKLEHFMLELGKGFLFEGRQRRFTFEGDSFFVDLVFYNRLLKCFVLFDLKIGKLAHQDIGQMQMYVNYYDRKIKLSEENNTIGIILCKEENKTVIEFTLPENNKQIFAKEYKAVLPTKAALAKQLQ